MFMNMERGPLVSILKYMLIHEKIKEELIEYMGMFYMIQISSKSAKIMNNIIAIISSYRQFSKLRSMLRRHSDNQSTLVERYKIHG